MKSLNENYVSTHGNTHETFADLMFLSLVVLVLFVMALAIEVHQRVRSDMAVIEPDSVLVVEEKELSEMTKKEVAELSENLRKQAYEIKSLRKRLDKNIELVDLQKRKVQNQMAALNGEQRFTGAREPASLMMAYNYNNRKFYFISARKFGHAEHKLSGESAFVFLTRQKNELVALALEARRQRGFTLHEAKAIYRAFSSYKEVVPRGSSYKIIDSVVGISYSTLLSAYIAGDTEISAAKESLVVLKLLKVYKEKGQDSDKMYPIVRLKIDESDRRIIVNGVRLSSRDAKEILLSIQGRGAMLDLEGFSGKSPTWLQEKVLIPAGYISKTPKLPGN